MTGIAFLLILALIGLTLLLIGSSGENVVLSIALLAFTVFYFISVIGILMRTSWGRIMGIITSALMLIRIPLGTIIGVMGLFAFIKAKELFGKSRITHKEVKFAFKELKRVGAI